MAHSKEEQARVLSRRAKVAALLLRGVTNQTEIAGRLGLDGDSGRRVVGYDIAAVEKTWRESGVRDLDAAKGKELDRLDVLEREAWEAWERSKTERTRSRTRRKTYPAAQGTATDDEAELHKEQRDGDPRFLALVLDCVKRRCEILGIDAPKKVAPVNPDGETPYDAGGFSPAEVLDLVGQVAARLGVATAGADRPQQEGAG